MRRGHKADYVPPSLGPIPPHVHPVPDPMSNDDRDLENVLGPGERSKIQIRNRTLDQSTPSMIWFPPSCNHLRGHPDPGHMGTPMIRRV
jgi:hypothetical protein